MSSKPYRIDKGSTTEAFHKSRAKFQFIGGGFGSGKTTALVIKALRIARDYPGCNMLLGRSTFPKLNSTLRREFFKWMPAHWKQSFNKNDNTLVLVNGTTIDFRYISQRDNEAGEGTSNLLSGNYDFVGIDQLEDPEITYKDFLDVIGRLRGTAEYNGNDPTMPASGPRWFVFTANPTRNWLYRRVVKPRHDHDAGITHPDLLCLRDPDTNAPILDADGRPQPIIDLFESSTYENKHNLPPDFIQTLESAYHGKMRERFLLGKWTGYEGLVYPEFSQGIHVVSHRAMKEMYDGMRMRLAQINIRESFDHGLSEPSCYLFAFIDDVGAVHIIDGFYEPGLGINALAARINEIRHGYAESRFRPDDERVILADPAIFRRGDARVVGPSVASMLEDEGLQVTRANNSLINGIVKVQAYMHIEQTLLHPYTGRFGAPKLYVSDKLTWWHDECQDYVWVQDKNEEYEDKPRDKKNHAMDATRYLLTDEPEPSRLHLRRELMAPPPHHTRWTEQPDEDEAHVA